MKELLAELGIQSLWPGFILGGVLYLIVRYVVTGFFTVDQGHRAVKVSFGRAHRLRSDATVNLDDLLKPDEQERYNWPALRVLPPGGPYFRWPWEKVRKVSVATETVNMAWDPENPEANHGGKMLEAVTKDQLNTGLTGQIRFRVSERNLYASLFGIKKPIAHVMGYFVSVLRQRIASFEAPNADGQVAGVSINDLRKNLRMLNEAMDRECAVAEARYGIVLEASLITGIDPPQEVESALAAINTAHNHVSSDISLAQASADQRIVQSRRAVEIETLKAQAEVEPLLALANQLGDLKRFGPDALKIYQRSVRLGLFAKARRAFVEVPHE